MRDDFSRYEEVIVRLFYDYTDTVVWFPDPVGYDEARLTPDLVEALLAWQRLYDEGLDSDFSWRSADIPERIERELPELARRLGDELGSAFEVEYSLSTGKATGWATRHKVRYRSAHQPTNPDAAAAFEARAVAARAERDRRAAIIRQAPPGSVGWFAWNPLTGERYDP